MKYPIDMADFPSAAVCLNCFGSEGPVLSPTGFRPLVPMTGGFSLLSRGHLPFSMMMAANAWINHVRETGASTENAIEAIALNGNQHPGLVALALEAAAMATKPKTSPEVSLTMEQYFGLVERLFLADVGGIYTLMHDEWGVSKKPDRPTVLPHKTRLEWGAELGHDVLIHPKNLLPIRSRAGYLEYLGTESSGSWAEMTFRLPGGELMVTERLPEQWQEAA
jgi:hypothetical protein